jgi:hypothetical protein
MTNERITEVKRVMISFAPVPQNHHLRATRFWLGIVIAGLILSGVTAFPLETELHFFLVLLQSAPLRPFAELTHLLPWISRVHDASPVQTGTIPFWPMALIGWPSPTLLSQLLLSGRTVILYGTSGLSLSGSSPLRESFRWLS